MRFRDHSVTRVFSLAALQYGRRQRDAERLDDTLIEDEPPTLREPPPDLAPTTELALDRGQRPRR